MMQAIAKLNADTTRDPQFTNVLIGMGMELFRSFREVLSGVQERVISRAALGARNLLELRYWTSFIAACEKNIWRVRKDALIDGRDTLDKFSTICSLWPELAQIAPLISQIRSDFDQQCQAHGELADGKYLRVANLAKDIGLAEEHRVMCSFLSKLIHPTGFSICYPRGFQARLRRGGVRSRTGALFLAFDPAASPCSEAGDIVARAH